ncbi:hypothetical protein AVEN_140704-1 [Araneus ventricosus]|uniref:Uncharacterized protein n=1 Tax=Araneus ventricosus TaxID=182803 RepID=A0A4Y2XA02_ARAVE|nr:hypothetical protein AVEN_140704-1 [Araneus ventricosus]
MDTYAELFEELDSIDWEKEATPAAALDDELNYSPDLPDFDEMANIPSPISPIHSPPAAAMDEPAMEPTPDDETKPAVPSQDEPAVIDKPPAMEYEPTSPPAIPSQKEPAMEYEPTSPPAALKKPADKENDCKPPAALKKPADKPSCKKEKEHRKYKRPSSSLRQKDPRISLKRKISPVRAPSTPLKVPTFAKTPKSDVPKRDVPKSDVPKSDVPHQDKGWKPVQSFKPVEERIFYHSTNHVLALREGEYVLTNGYETASRKNEKHWHQALEEDLRFIAKSTRSVYCVDRLSYNLLARELEKWPNHHPFKTRVAVKVWEADPELRPCSFCLSTNCVKWLAIRGGVQRFFRYEIDMLVH